jgi:hypothetical protein
MALVDTLYVVTLVGSIPIIGVALYYVLNNLGKRGAYPLAALLAGSIVWVACSLIYSLAPTFQVALWANRLQYVGIVITPASWVLFALLYSDREHLVNNASIGLLSIEPLVVLGLVATNLRHDLWFTTAVPEGETYVVDGSQVACDAVICFGANGPGFLAHTLYSYVLLLTGAALVLSRALRSDAIPRGQAASMAVAVTVPTVGNVLSLFVLPDSVPDLTPVTFVVMGVAVVVGLYRYSLVDTDALTGAVSVRDREEPAVLVDDDHRVVEINVAGAAVLGVDADRAVGATVDEAFAEQSTMVERYREDPLEPGSLAVADPISGERYEVVASEVDPEGTPRRGWLYAFSGAD